MLVLPDSAGPSGEAKRCNASEPVFEAPYSRSRLQSGGCGPVRMRDGAPDRVGR